MNEKKSILSKFAGKFKLTRRVVTWVLLVFFAVTASGCALLGTAVSAGIAYGIYQATKR